MSVADVKQVNPFTMNRDYAISLGVAAGLHVVLLFGYRSHESAPTLSPPDKTALTELFMLPPPELVRPDPEEPPTRKDSFASLDPKTLTTETEIVRPTLPPVHPDTPTFPAIDVAGPLLPYDPAPPRGPIGGGGTDVIPGEWLDREPRTQFQSAPLYPFEARRDGRYGEVQVEFVVDEHGFVHDPHVVASTDPIFDAATLRAVARWRFEPGRRNGQVVRFKMIVPVRFSLGE